MYDVEVGDVMQEEPAHPAEEIAVYRRCCATLEVPRAVAVVGKVDRSMVKVGDHDEPAASHVRSSLVST